MTDSSESNVTYVTSVLDCTENTKTVIFQPMAGKTDEEIAGFSFFNAIGNQAIAFVGTSGVQLGWLASQADMLAEDWIL